MKKFFMLAWMAFSALSAAYAQQRVVQNLNYGWRFHAGTIEQAGLPSYNDANWWLVDVPHDFQSQQQRPCSQYQEQTEQSWL